MILFALAFTIGALALGSLAALAARDRRAKRRVARRRIYDRVATENPNFTEAIRACTGRNPVETQGG